jgi:hypothetical protein
MGVCNLTGKTFGELIRHFIFAWWDETCMQACANGVVKVVGSAGRKKHEKKTNDSRVSITMYRTGNIADVTGPTIFLLEGKRKREGFTDKFLVDHGAAIGSKCIMTATAFMTEEAWVQATPSVIKGLRSSDPIVQANPQWWVLEVFDGHGPHTMSLPAMQLRYDSKILSLKEEGDSSQVNQAYDKFVAPADKSAKDESLAMLRGCTLVNKGVVDQWGLVHVGLFAIRALKAGTWTNSFQACNMDPLTSLSFPQWCKKIEHFIQAGQSFKTEGPLNTYALLPSFWHGMTVEERKNTVGIIDKHDGVFTVELCKELHKECSIAYKDQQSIRVCYDLTKAYPEQLDMESPSIAEREAVREAPEVTAAHAALSDVNKGLASFEFMPTALKGTGIPLFDHMVSKRCIDPKGGLKDAPSAHYDVSITIPQRDMLKATSLELTKREIMKYAGGHGATIKMAARKLDQLGYIKAHSGVANDSARLKKLRNQLQLANSLASIERSEAAIAKKKKTDSFAERLAMAPTAVVKLAEKGGQVTRLTKKDISSLLFVYFSVDMDEVKHKKLELVTKLDERMVNDPEKLPANSVLV